MPAAIHVNSNARHAHEVERNCPSALRPNLGRSGLMRAMPQAAVLSCNGGAISRIRVPVRWQELFAFDRQQLLDAIRSKMTHAEHGYMPFLTVRR